MKNLGLKLVLVAIFGFSCIGDANAQSKSELSAQVKIQADSISKMQPRLTSLETMYDAAKIRVGKDFDPASFKTILDSATAVGLKKDSVYTNLKTQNASFSDSLKVLVSTTDSLTKSVDDREKIISHCIVMINLFSDKPVTREDVEKGMTGQREEVIKELKQLKDLLDSGILTQKEFDDKKAIVLKKW